MCIKVCDMRLEKLSRFLMSIFAGEEALRAGKNSIIWSSIFNYAVDELQHRDHDYGVVCYGSTRRCLWIIWGRNKFGSTAERVRLLIFCSMVCSCSRIARRLSDQVRAPKTGALLKWQFATPRLSLAARTLSNQGRTFLVLLFVGWGAGHVIISVFKKPRVCELLREGKETSRYCNDGGRCDSLNLSFHGTWSPRTRWDLLERKAWAAICYITTTYCRKHLD